MIGKEVEPTTRNKGAAWEATQDSFREYSFPLFFFFLFCSYFLTLRTMQELSVGGRILHLIHAVFFLKKKGKKK